RRAGVRRFILVSTVKAVAEASRRPLDDHTEPRPVDPYGVSKLEAERLVDAHPEATGLATTILRLPLVYGPRMKGNMLSLFRLVDRGLPLPLGLVDNRRSLAFVGNVAGAIVAVLGAAEPPAGPCFVSDGRDLSTPELLRAIAAALGRPARLLPVPPVLFRAAGRLGDLLSRLLPVPLTSAAVDRLLGSLAVDSSGLDRALGYHPPYTVEEGLRLTAEWYRETRA
ncbi:MAG TPA: NAD-dependent epimerase/dehydratase family protein, partial [Gemmatimonadales bacterium]|nr:NAD-dependent epimerase/dehydratase family protein [Gemmatimonadales bacterium]